MLVSELVPAKVCQTSKVSYPGSSCDCSKYMSCTVTMPIKSSPKTLVLRFGFMEGGLQQ